MSEKQRIVHFSAAKYDIKCLKDIHRELQLDEYEFDYCPDALSPTTIAFAKGARAVTCFVNDDLSEPILKKLSEMDIHTIALRCAGFDRVDLDAAKKYNIHVARVPRYSPEAVAEFCVGLALAAIRRIPQGNFKCKMRNFSLEGQMGFVLNGKTVGILGTGLIGSLVAKSFRYGFNCNVIVYDAFPNEAMKKEGFKYVSPEELYKQSDIISIHIPLLPTTENMLNKAAFDQMKNGVVIVNTSRGGLIDMPSFIEAFRKGKISAAGLDVMQNEKEIFFSDHSNDIILDDSFSIISNFPNVILTGHQAYFARESMDQISQVTIDNIKSLLKGETEPIKDNMVA